MPDEFKFETTANEVLEEFEQDEAFKSRFIGLCQRSMEGRADKNDLIRLIEDVHLTEEERAHET